MPGRIQLHLIRHAIAEERGPAWPDDRVRPLSDEGRRCMKRQAAGFVSLGDRPDLILTSPLVRTRQTADIVAAAFDDPPRIVELPALAPDGKPKEVAQALETYSRRPSLALVGHEPGLGELAAFLIGARAPLPFKKGGMALIEVALLPPPAGSGELRWLLPPRILRRLSSK
ncbi:MAG TPA: phosphohistidine phosphatase SixA [Vicinamibacterales bacterium]